MIFTENPYTGILYNNPNIKIKLNYFVCFRIIPFLFTFTW